MMRSHFSSSATSMILSVASPCQHSCFDPRSCRFSQFADSGCYRRAVVPHSIRILDTAWMLITCPARHHIKDHDQAFSSRARMIPLRTSFDSYGDERTFL